MGGGGVQATHRGGHNGGRSGNDYTGQTIAGCTFLKATEIRGDARGHTGIVWEYRHTCGAICLGIPSRIRIRNPKWCDECRPGWARGRRSKYCQHQPKAKSGNGWKTTVRTKLVHICGCTKHMPCQRASRMLALGMTRELERHLEFTYRPDGTCIHPDYKYPAMAPDDPL
jgi:hypothetical protein